MALLPKWMSESSATRIGGAPSVQFRMCNSNDLRTGSARAFARPLQMATPRSATIDMTNISMDLRNMDKLVILVLDAVLKEAA